MDKRALISFVALLALAFVAGRYSAPERIKIETKVVTKVEVHEVSKASAETGDQKVKVVTQIVKPDGTRINRTRFESRHETSSEITKEIENKSEVVSETKKEIINRSGVLVSGMVGLPLNSDITKGPVYGASFSKQLIGPISVGAFGFTDMRIGLSVGLEL